MNDKQDNINITEQDIFNYVFCPEILKAETSKLISGDSSLYEAIAFYKQMKSDAEQKPDINLKKKIAEKIPAYTLSNVITLYPLKLVQPQKRKANRLVAASTELKPQTSTKTFVDSPKEYLIKVLNYGETTKVFVFSTKDEVVKDFNIIIEPQNLEYHLDDNSEPLVLDKMIDAESIKIKFDS